MRLAAPTSAVLDGEVSGRPTLPPTLNLPCREPDSLRGRLVADLGLFVQE
jgi:hypothetical protein